MYRKTVLKVSGGDWKGPPAEGGEVEKWHYQLVGIGRPESQSRWHVSDPGEVGRQIHRCSAVHRSVGQYGDLEQNSLRDTKPVKIVSLVSGSVSQSV